MGKTAILFAKIAGLQKNFNELNWSRNNRVLASHVDHLIEQFVRCRIGLISDVPELFSDIPMVSIPDPITENPDGVNLYTYNQIIPIVQNIDYILEVRAGSRIGEKVEYRERNKRVFITHGRSPEWYKVQAYIEKDLGLPTLELAQEASTGRTVIQKLDEEAEKCRCAVIVMTGDDIFEKIVQVRENVMHETGFFRVNTVCEMLYYYMKKE